MQRLHQDVEEIKAAIRTTFPNDQRTTEVSKILDEVVKDVQVPLVPPFTVQLQKKIIETKLGTVAEMLNQMSAPMEDRPDFEQGLNHILRSSLSMVRY
uniref:Uncharacterized protein n=1 Tax=Panagrolaimus sp. JU765 TaxID=591449 RepID=A0AC34QR66_9BILA